MMTKKTDSEIKQLVTSELQWDQRVDETEVGVQVQHGIVTLTGVVPSLAKRVAAEEAAHRVVGVLDVANDLRVKAPGSGGRTDTEIAAAVRSALEWDVFCDDTRIRSTVTDGRVTLTGTVESLAQRDEAEQAIRNLAGVCGIVNRLAVEPAPVGGDVRNAIEAALARRAERDAHRIDVTVKDGSVTVRGVVHSWLEKAAVLGAARGTAGVHTIHDELRIHPWTD